MASEKTLAIMDAFHKSLQSGDESLIEGYSKKDIMAALSEISPRDVNHAWYRAMERKLDQLERLEEKNRAMPEGAIMANKRLAYDFIHAFLSHKHDDVGIARALKKCLESFGAQAFLAHEDIRPSAIWQKVILRHLTDVCNIFVPILTSQFHESEWTDQEVGMAIARGMVIAPVKIEIDPYGFMASAQAVPPQGPLPASAHFTCVELLSGIAAEYPELKSAIKKCIIRSLRACSTFDEAGASAESLLEFEPFTQAESNEVAEIVAGHDQVYGAGSAAPHLERFFQRYGNLVNPELIRRCDELRVRPVAKS